MIEVNHSYEVSKLEEAGLVYVKYSCSCCVGLAVKGMSTGLRLRQEGELGSFNCCIPNSNEKPTVLAHEHAVDLHRQVTQLLEDGLKYRRLQAMMKEIVK